MPDRLEPIRILNVIRFPIGGIRSYLRYTYSRIDPTLYVATVVTVDRPEARLLAEGMNPVHVDLHTVPERRALLGLTLATNALLRTGAVGMIHSQGTTAAIVSDLSARRHGVPHVVTLHETFRADQFSGVLGAAKRRLSWDLIRQATESTAKLSAFVVFILVGARVFSLTFYGVNGHVWVEHLLTSLPGGQIGFLIFVNAFVFILAFFLDFFELAFIIIPLLGPAAEKLGIDLIWFGVILGVNMQTSFMHPPFGFALF